MSGPHQSNAFSPTAIGKHKGIWECNGKWHGCIYFERLFWENKVQFIGWYLLKIVEIYGKIMENYGKVIGFVRGLVHYSKYNIKGKTDKSRSLS